MKMIMKEVGESLKQRKGFTFFIMLQIFVLLLAVTILFLHYIQIEKKSAQVHALQSLSSFQLSDTLLSNSDFNAFLDEPDSLLRLKKLYSNLEHQLGEKYIYMFTQPIDIRTSAYQEKFLVGYEDGVKREPFLIEGEGPYQNVKAIQLNQQAWESYQIKIADGANFSAVDFQHHSQGMIPVLLGAEYSGTYQIGDRLAGNYLFKDFQLIVKGFIQPNTLVFNKNNPELYVDRYIVMPAQQFAVVPADEKELYFQQIHYLQMINGTIFSAENEYVVRSKFEHIKAISDFPDTMLIGMTNLPLHFIFAALSQNMLLLAIMAVSLFVVCMLSIAILMKSKLQDNMNNYSIHLVSGATRSNLFAYMLAEMIVLLAIPGTIAVQLYSTVIDVHVGTYALLVAACIGCMLMLSAAPIYYQFRKWPVSMLLKRTG
ncbi:ABC transporter permease [Paenibacillus sp. 481]|uniref:ABC transporter permease n=1 Tax=Paenibacillus sp. 481 TaxID=2835869 RepID=UPI001E3070E3|nr:ABC transporter permease [Paenibacillus sp. 481]UHA72112.1 ABC transporter permease [Paenibacillus sp. 481]